MQRWNGSTWQNVANFNTTYRQDNAPTGTLFVGDTWFDTNDGNRQYVWDGAQWRDVADTRIAQALLDASNAQSTADGAIQSYYQDDQPTNGSEGDFWIDTNDGNKLYVYNSGAWVESQDSDIQQAINDAAGAQATADGKVTTFFDVVVSNVHLYAELASEGDPEPEAVRSNIDIGGPGMIRAGVRNYLRVATIVDPDDYGMVIDHVKSNSGPTSLDLRLELARKAFRLIARNDVALADYFGRLDGDSLQNYYDEQE